MKKSHDEESWREVMMKSHEDYLTLIESHDEETW